MSAGGIQDLVDALAERLGRSVIIDDPDIKLLYASKHFGDDDEVRRHALLQRDAGPEVIGYVLSHGVTNWMTAGVIPPSDELGLHTRICVPIRWRADLLGLLMVVDSDGTLTTGEMSTITQVSVDLATLMYNEHPTDIDEDEQALSDALDDLVAIEPALRRAAVRTLTARIGDQGDRHIRVISLAAYEGRVPSVPGHASAGFRHAIVSAGSRPIAWTLLSAVHEDRATLLVTSKSPISDDAASDFASDLVAKVHAVATDRFRCVAGVGGAGVGLEHARASYRQAEVAALAGKDVYPKPQVSWTELGDLAVVLQMPLDQLNEECLPDEVQRLLAYDKDGRSVETVLAYLDHAGSAPETADALHLHRTTLYYRLLRIREATGLDLDNGRTRLALHIGLRLRDVLLRQMKS